jgi:hypothetical protein
MHNNLRQNRPSNSQNPTFTATCFIRMHSYKSFEFFVCWLHGCQTELEPQRHSCHSEPPSELHSVLISLQNPPIVILLGSFCQVYQLLSYLSAVPTGTTYFLILICPLLILLGKLSHDSGKRFFRTSEGDSLLNRLSLLFCVTEIRDDAQWCHHWISSSTNCNLTSSW